MTHNGGDRPTDPGTPSTLAMLNEARALLARVVGLFEDIDHTIRHKIDAKIDPLVDRVAAIEHRVDRLSRDTIPAPPSLPPEPGA